MRGIKTTFVALVVVCSSSVLCAQSASPRVDQRAEWKLIEPEGANFSIEFPASPVTREVTAEGGLVWKVLALDQERESGRVFTIEYMSGRSMSALSRKTVCPRAARWA